MGLNCSEQGAQPLCSSSFWDIDPLAFSRLGWAAGVNFHNPWFHTCITNCGPEPNSPQALQTDTKLAGPGWVWGLCEGWMVREMSPWLRHTRGMKAGGQREKQSWKMIRGWGTNILWTLCFSSNQLLVFFSLLPLPTLTFPCGQDSFEFIFLGLFGFWFCVFFLFGSMFSICRLWKPTPFICAKWFRNLHDPTSVTWLLF